MLIVDDLLATGGTVSATIELVERLGGKVMAVAFLVELTALNGRDRLRRLRGGLADHVLSVGALASLGTRR